MTPEDPEIKSLILFSQKFLVAPTSGMGSGRRTLQVLQPSAVNKNLGRIIEVLAILKFIMFNLFGAKLSMLNPISPGLEWQIGS